MSIKPSLSKKGSRDEFEDESSVSSSDSQDSTSKGDRKLAAERTGATATRGSSSRPPKEAVIELFSESDGESVGEDGDVFNIYVEMRTALLTRANAKDGFNPAALLSLLQGLITNKDLIVQYVNSLEGETRETKEEVEMKATMLNSVIPDEMPSSRASRKEPIVNTLLSIWKTIRSIGLNLPPREVITGRHRRSNTPKSDALDAYGEYTSLMLQCEFNCRNAKIEKDEKHKMMKTVKITGEFYLYWSRCHCTYPDGSNITLFSYLTEEERNRPWQGLGSCGNYLTNCPHCDHGIIDFLDDPKDVNKRNQKMKKVFEKEIAAYEKSKKKEKETDPLADLSVGKLNLICNTNHIVTNALLFIVYRL